MHATLFALVLSSSTAHADDDKRVEFSGDLRYRNEWSITRPGDEDMRWRQRVRARLGAEVTIVKDVVTGEIRLRTGSPGDANSPHQTMGNAFSSYTVSFDQVYMQWNPVDNGTWIRAGKQPHDFANGPVYGDFIWDADVNPDGLAAHVVVVGGDEANVSWALNPAAYLTLEVNNGADGDGYDMNDGYLLAGQSELTFAAGDGHITLGNALYALSNTLDDESTLLAENQGNPTDSAGTKYLDGFTVLDNEVGAKLVMGEQKVDLGARVVYNLSAQQDAMGWQAGAALPLEAGEVGLKPFADVHAMQAQAMYSNVVQDDHQVGVGFFGFVAGVDVKPAKAVSVRVWGIFDKSDTATEADPAMNSRVRVDMNGKF